MQILQSWKDSLTLLQPKNLKLFCMVTLKSILSTYKTLLTYFWWFILILLVSYYFNIAILSSEYVPLIFWYSKRAALFFLMLLVARPSTVIKNGAYFKQYWRHFTWAMLFYLAMVPALMVPIYCLLNLIFFGSVSGPQGEGLSIFISLFTLPLLALIFAIVMMMSLFILLFLLDSDATVKSFGLSLIRGVKMFWYNVPFCLVFMVVRYSIVFSLIYFVARPYNSVLLDFLLPIPVCFITNFYVKKLHEQFTIYFKPVENKG